MKATAKKKNPQDDKHLISPHWKDENYFHGNPLNVHNTVPPAFRILTVCLIKIKANYFHPHIVNCVPAHRNENIG